MLPELAWCGAECVGAVRNRFREFASFVSVEAAVDLVFIKTWSPLGVS